MSAMLAILATTLTGVGAPEPIEADVAWTVSGEFCEPETVLPLPDDTLLVSNVCGFREPRSGFLTLLSADGQVLDWRVDLQSHSVETVGPEWLADIDGIEFEPDGTLQVTPVAGPLVRYRSEQDIEILAGEGISSANHGYAATLNLALIPTGFDNTVIAIRVASDDSR